MMTKLIFAISLAIGMYGMAVSAENNVEDNTLVLQDQPSDLAYQHVQVLHTSDSGSGSESEKDLNFYYGNGMEMNSADRALFAAVYAQDFEALREALNNKKQILMLQILNLKQL